MQGSTEVEVRRRAPAIVDGVDTIVKRFITIRDFGSRITRMYGIRIRYITKAEGIVL
jgi:hypothetical protein